MLTEGPVSGTASKLFEPRMGRLEYLPASYWADFHCPDVDNATEIQLHVE